MGQIPVYVISLLRAPERRKAITAHLDGLGLAYEVVDAVDGKTLSPDELRSVVAPGVQLHPGMIGCNLSHHEVSRRFLASGREVCLILEDDARLHTGVATMLREGIDATGFDILFLDCADRNPHGLVFYDRDDSIGLAGGFRAHRLSAGPQRTHAMLLSRSAAMRRDAHMLPIRDCIDTYDHLPLQFRFYSVIHPKAAWLSEHSLETFTSQQEGRVRQLSFMRFRRSMMFYRLHDLLTMKWLRRRWLVKLLASEHILDPSRRWAPLSGSASVVV